MWDYIRIGMEYASKGTEYASKMGNYLAEAMKEYGKEIALTAVIGFSAFGCEAANQGPVRRVNTRPGINRGLAGKGNTQPGNTAQGGVQDPVALEMKRMREMIKKDMTMREWDDLARKWEMLDRQTRIQAEMERRQTRGYIRGLRQGVQPQQFQNPFNDW